tara:strand:+ start:29 stop:346 length:318 start_codon:yes stop_codon:yes gene_type:complete
MLGGNIGSKIAQKISNTSKKYNHSESKNKKYQIKKSVIRKEINNYIENHWINDYDTILVGHYHQTGIDNIDDKKIIYLGDWLNYYTVTYLNNEGWGQTSWKENKI